MSYRNILYALTLIAYALFMAHSVIPHHHHKDLREAEAHEKQEHDNSHHHHGHSHGKHHHDQNHKSESNHSHAGHLFFLNHGASFEVAVRTAFEAKFVKAKASANQFVDSPEPSIPGFYLARYLRYHPPQDDDPPVSIAISVGLRAPPIHVI